MPTQRYQFPYSDWTLFLQVCENLSIENKIKLGNPYFGKILSQAIQYIHGLNQCWQASGGAVAEEKGKLHDRAYKLQLSLQKLMSEILKLAKKELIEVSYVTESQYQDIWGNSHTAISNAYYFVVAF